MHIKLLLIAYHIKSTCVAMSGKRRTSDLDVTDSRPHIRYVLLVNIAY